MFRPSLYETLDSLHEALKLIARDWEAGPTGKPAIGVPMAMMLAIQAACAAALLPIIDREPEILAHPRDADRLGPPSRLLSHVCAGDHLSEELRLDLSHIDERRIEMMQAWRNLTVHSLKTSAIPDAPACLELVVRIVKHLVTESPVFASGGEAVLIALLKDDLRVLERLG
ncbi:MAG: hypothetical protein ACRBEQ_13590 [Hyphomonas sp.]